MQHCILLFLFVQLPTVKMKIYNTLPILWTPIHLDANFMGLQHFDDYI